jgi:hypothetical protein
MLQLFMERHKPLDRPVVSLLDFFWKIASRQLIMLSMASYAFAAFSFQVTVVSAWAFFQVSLKVLAFTHFALNLGVHNLLT